MTTTNDPRHTRAWRALRDRVVREEPICRLQIAGVCTRVSTTGDHIITIHQRPDLALVRTNVRGACEPCNRTRGQMPDSAIARADHVPPALSIFD
jgi:5-methylcytosine-specific restriction endonuclease McrA